MADSKSTRIDPDLVNLSGGAFDSLPQEVLPLDVFGLRDVPVERTRADVWLTDTAVMPLVRPRHDSLAPMTSSSVPPPPPSSSSEARRSASSRASWALGVAIAAGAFGFGVGGAALTLRAPASAPASAPAMMAPQIVAAAPEVKATEEKPAPIAKAAEEKAAPIAKAAEEKAAPVAKVIEKSPVTKAAPKPVAPKAVAPADTADLPMPVIPPPPPAPAVDINRAAVSMAIASAGARASSCREEGSGPASAPVTLIFAPSGRVTSAVVNGGPFAGTKEGACLATILRGATVPAFTGDPVTVTTTVHVR